VKLPRPLSAPLTLLVGLLVLLLAAPATASFSSSTSFGYAITTGTWEQPDEDEEEDTEPDPSDPDEGDEGDEEAERAKVWVCKLTGPPDAPTLKDGPEPIEVAAAATTEDRLNEKHRSPVVEGADTDCEEVLADLMEHAEDLPSQSEDAEAAPEPDDAAPHGDPDAHGDTDEQHDTANDDDEEPLIEESADTAGQPVEAHQGADGPAETSEPDGDEDQ